MFSGTFVLIKIRPVTAEILLPKRLCDGGVFRDYMACKPILVFSLSLSQAEQQLKPKPS